MEDPILDTEEHFAALTERLLGECEGHCDSEAVKNALIEAYKFGLLMGAAAERAQQRRQNPWD